MKTKTKVHPLPRKHRTPWRLKVLATPKRHFIDTGEGMPEILSTGVRKSAVNGDCSDRIADIALPYLRRLFALKREYKHIFSPERLERLSQKIEASNNTVFAKLANCNVDLKKVEGKKKKAWSDGEWRSHMDYISVLAEPKKVHLPKRGKKKKWKPLDMLIPRVIALSKKPSFKIYKRLSQEDWYRDPRKVSPKALQYTITERMKVLAKHREPPAEQ